MLQKTRSKTIAKAKFLLMLPLMLLMLTGVAFADQDLKEKEENSVTMEDAEETKDKLILQETAMPVALVDEVPIFPGCDQ